MPCLGIYPWYSSYENSPSRCYLQFFSAFAPSSCPLYGSLYYLGLQSGRGECTLRWAIPRTWPWFWVLSIFDKLCSAWWISARPRSPSSSPSSFFIYNLTSRSQFNSTATNTTRRSSNETDESLIRTVILGCLGREITAAVSLVNCVASVVDYEGCSPEDTEVMVVVGTLLVVAKITRVQQASEGLVNKSCMCELLGFDTIHVVLYCSILIWFYVILFSVM